jgi:hypothetical protein
MKYWLAIIGLCILTCVLYGILHDLIAIYMCPVYFTAFYPLPQELLESKILLGTVLGIASTWWLGLVLGTIVAVAARCGALPRLGWKALVRFLATLIVVALLCTAVAGTLGYFLAQRGVLAVAPSMAELIPEHERPRFWAVGFMNLAAYATAVVGGIVLLVWIRLHRRRSAQTSEK